MSSRARRVRLLAVLVVAACAAAGCSGGSHKKVSSTPTAPVTTAAPSTSAAATSPAPKPATPVNPLTGGVVSRNAVVAVKIDDTANGRPQRGIEQADVVYVEQVEGGLARLLAVFHTHLPVVEAVRSTRANDPELLAQYGPIGFVASGGGGNSLNVLRKSTLKASIDDWNGPGLFRDPNRPMPYNLEANLATVAKDVGAGPAKNVGFTFSASVGSLAGTPAAGHVTTQVGSTTVRFDYSASLKRYVRIIGGAQAHAADGAVISTPNVIVQFVRVSPDPSDVDVAGNTSMYTHSVGSGTVVVFRNGHRVAGTWSRASGASGTVFKDSKGHLIPLAPGGEYVLLVANGTPIS